MEDIYDELSRIISHIKKIAQPERIILFGSAARRTMNPNSDLDFLIVKKGDYNPRELAGEIYLSMEDVDVPVDLLIVTPDQLNNYQKSTWSVLYPALQEGKVMYERGTV
jgi:predicted nucleotidyltransferase